MITSGLVSTHTGAYNGRKHSYDPLATNRWVMDPDGINQGNISKKPLPEYKASHPNFERPEPRSINYNSIFRTRVNVSTFAETYPSLIKPVISRPEFGGAGFGPGLGGHGDLQKGLAPIKEERSQDETILTPESMMELVNGHDEETPQNINQIHSQAIVESVMFPVKTVKTVAKPPGIITHQDPVQKTMEPDSVLKDEDVSGLEDVLRGFGKSVKAEVRANGSRLYKPKPRKPPVTKKLKRPEKTSKKFKIARKAKKLVSF